MTNKDLSSIHRSPPRGPKRPRKPRGPSEPKAAASSLSAHVPVRSEKAVRAVGRKFTHTEVGASLPRFSIHRSAWKSSPQFAVASYYSTLLQPLDNRPWCSPPAPKRSDLVAVVAPFCIKGLRLVTMQLPEKFSPIGVGTNRSSHIRLSRKFANGTSTSVSLIRLTESLLWGLYRM